MEDKPIKEVSQKLTKKERLERQFRKGLRELRIKRIRAGVIRSQTLQAYSIIDGVRFDYLSDTAFRDCYTEAKIALEHAFNDFLLDDGYWVERIKKLGKMTPEQYDQYMNGPTIVSGKKSK